MVCSLQKGEPDHIASLLLNQFIQIILNLLLNILFVTPIGAFASELLTEDTLNSLRRSKTCISSLERFTFPI